MAVYVALDHEILHRLPTGDRRYVAGLLCSAVAAPTGPDGYQDATVIAVMLATPADTILSVSPAQSIRLNPLHVAYRIVV